MATDSVSDNENNQVNDIPDFDECKNNEWKKYLKKNLFWFCLTVFLFSSIIVLYVSVHSCGGSINKKISQDDIVSVTAILNGQKNALDKKIADTLKADTAKNRAEINKSSIIDSLRHVYQIQSRDLIRGYFNSKYDTELLKGPIDNSFSDKTIEQMIILVPDMYVTLKEFFWLGDEKRFLEVIFWSLFGFFCSFLFYYSEYLRKGSFKIQELPVYFAKFFYAPVLALVIVFGYNLVSTTSYKVDDTSYGLLLFAFILGFFSGRTVEYLNKIKELLLPTSSTSTTSSSTILGSIIGSISIADSTKANLTKGSLKIKAVSQTNPNIAPFKGIITGDKYCFTGLPFDSYDVVVDYSTTGAVAPSPVKSKSVTLDKNNHEVKLDIDV